MKRMNRTCMAVFCAFMMALSSAGAVMASGTEDPTYVTQVVEQPPVASPAPPPAPSDQKSNVAEGVYGTPNQDDFNWKEDPSVKVSASAASSSLNLPARNAILVSTDTGEVLYEMQADQRVPIASITKVMTLLLTFEAIEAGKVSLQDKVPVSEHAYNMGGSQIWLEPGEIFTLNEMIKAIVVSSANDAAVAVAEFIGGTEDAFAQMMTARAKELGMENTNFKNACGLDEEGHYSTARDVSIMAQALMKHDKVMEYTKIWTDTLRGGKTQIVNTNKMLKTYPGITGLKTGTTSGAGVCIAASATRDNMGLLAVVLGSPSSAERFVAAKKLLDYGFAQYERVAFPAVQGFMQQLPVQGGLAEVVDLSIQVPDAVLLKKGQSEQLTASVQLPEVLQAPLSKNQQIAEVVLMSGAQEIGRYPVSVQSEIPAMDQKNAWNMLWKSLAKIG